MEIRVLRRLEEKNQATADEIRASLDRHGVRLLNIMGSPGCGKTTLLEHLLPVLGTSVRCAVLEGDLFTTRDAERIAALNVPVIQLETQGSCHLDAPLVLRALQELPLDRLDFVVVENVGNLVCPANFDLGETSRLAVVSVTEGHDKPSKYPLLFARAGAVVITKTDLIKYTDFDMDAARADIRRYNEQAPLFTFNHRDGVGRELAEWVAGQATKEPSTQ
jgi:hydrogenase nickel incorporation protein HypB